MPRGIAVHLAGAGLQHARTHAARKTQNIHGAHDAGLHGLDWVVLIVARRRGARQIINLIHFKLNWIGHVRAHQFKVGIAQQMFDVSAVAGEEIIQTNHLVTLRNQAVAQV